MNRPTSLLQRHLLTRSDLAELGVPATEVFRWLADGLLEQVGELPLDGRDDPVFTVLSAELRRDLSERLASIDKSTVVMTPLGVRSFLLRALLHRRSPLPADEAALLPVESDEPALDDAQAQKVTKEEIGDVLQDLVVHRIDDDVQTVLQLAAEIAATESVRAGALRPIAATTTEPNTQQTDAATEDEPMANTPEPDDLLDAAPNSEPTKNADDESFSTDDLDAGDVFVEIEFDDEPAQQGAQASEPDSEELGEMLAAEAEVDSDEVADDEPSSDVETTDDDDAALGDLIADVASDDADEEAEEEPVELEAVFEEPTDEADVEAAVVEAEQPEAQLADEAEDQIDGTEPADEAPAELDATIDGAEQSEAELAEEVEDHNDATQQADEAPAEFEAPIEEAVEQSTNDADVEAAIAEPDQPEAELADEAEDQGDGTEQAEDSPNELEASVDEVFEAADDEPTAQTEAAAVEALPEGDIESTFAESEPTTDDGAEAFAATEDLFEEPAADEPANDESPDEAAEFAMTSATMDRVQDFLGELKTALVEMAQRPAPQPDPEQNKIDVEPLVQAVQAGFERSAEQATQTTSALASLAARMGEFGERVESGVASTVRSMHAPHAAESGPVMAMAAAPTEFVEDGSRRQRLVIGAVALLIVCWSILFWFKTGSPRLALGTLVGANAVACCLLLARRD